MGNKAHEEEKVGEGWTTAWMITQEVGREIKEGGKKHLLYALLV